MVCLEAWNTVVSQGGRHGRGGYGPGRGGGRGGRGRGGQGGALRTLERSFTSNGDGGWGYGKFNMPAISLSDSEDPKLNSIADMLEEETCVREDVKNKEVESF